MSILNPIKHIRINRHELAGAFGDMGTDLPLLIGIIAASGMDAASVLIMFGLMQLFTGLYYRLPMPVQPLKAFAAIVIANKLAPATIMGGGLAIGLIMLLLTVTGLIGWLGRQIPKCVVRGIQLGLGLQLATLALREYIQTEALPGYLLAAACFVVAIILAGNKKYPPALAIILLGVLYALLLKFDRFIFSDTLAFKLPVTQLPTTDDIITGFLLLALPQIPLSIGNSILATQQVVKDLFPAKEITTSKISLSYSLMNLINPFFSGIPVCHGSGGIAGHYAFGARSGGSVLIYGSLFLLTGLFASNGFDILVQFFPMPVLGVLLLFEGLAIASLMRDTAGAPAEFAIAILVGLICIGLPYGYLVGLITGTLLFRLAPHALLLKK